MLLIQILENLKFVCFFHMNKTFEIYTFHFQTLDLLAKFQAKLHNAKEQPIANPPENETKLEQIADKAGEEFLAHRFVSEQLLDDVQDIYTNAELLSVYDPRNEMTKRRRDESSALLHQKKHKGRT